MGGSQNKMAEKSEDSKDQEDPVTFPPAAPPSNGPFRSVVQFAYQPGGPFPSHCGYCHSENEQFKLEGILSDKMSALDFQTLVDSGFQRSGMFVYLPANLLTCCPQYVLRLDTKTFRISKQQRRVIRKMNEYLINGLQQYDQREEGMEEEREEENTITSESSNLEERQEENKSKSDNDVINVGVVQSMGGASKEGVVQVDRDATPISSKQRKKVVTPGKGADPNLPPCKKAKEKRRERREQKGAPPKVVTMETSERACTNVSELLQLPSLTPSSFKHKLTIKRICVNPMEDEFLNSYETSYEVFRKFQTIIHKEPPEKCEREHFDQFCINSPLTQEEGPPGTDIKYGSYHQQYWVNDNLIMVGVIDIIPQGVLCNYLYYDPYYRFIAPGVYSAMHEIAMTQELYRKDPNLRYYYMGYYVHNCPKMNYKRRYDSSYLLCPLSLSYEPLEVCRTKLDSVNFCKFSSETTPIVDRAGERRIDDVLIEASNEHGYVKYSMIRQFIGDKLDDMISKYLETVGERLALTMVLRIQGLQI